MATIFLNGVEIGQQTFAEITPNFEDPPESFTVTDPSLFQAGTNTLEFGIYNFGGPTAFDYKATVSLEAPQSTAAKVWVGLKNSDSVGLRLDLKAEVFINSTGNPPVGAGQLDNVTSGSSGFNNSLLNTISLAVTGPVDLAPGDQLLLKVSVRRTCAGGGHASGWARLWYNGAAIDSGAMRDAGSRLDATVNGSGSVYYLGTGFVLSTTAGTSRTFIDRFVNSSASCPNRPFVAFGTWSLTP